MKEKMPKPRPTGYGDAKHLLPPESKEVTLYESLIPVIFEQSKKEMLERAIHELPRAVSHRDFRVGASILAVREKNEKTFKSIYSGHNFTPMKGLKNVGTKKRCAERTSAEQGVFNGYERIPAIVVVSDETLTEPGKADREVLLPCEECKKYFKELWDLGIMSGQTIIFSRNTKTGAEKQTTLMELLQMPD